MSQRCHIILPLLSEVVNNGNGSRIINDKNDIIFQMVHKYCHINSFFFHILYNK